MGTTAKNAGSQENFTKIDKEYVEHFLSLDNPLFLPSSFFYFTPAHPRILGFL
jgi:hypothetical protein